MTTGIMKGAPEYPAERGKWLAWMKKADAHPDKEIRLKSVEHARVTLMSDALFQAEATFGLTRGEAAALKRLAAGFTDGEFVRGEGLFLGGGAGGAKAELRRDGGRATLTTRTRGGKTETLRLSGARSDIDRFM